MIEDTMKRIPLAMMGVDYIPGIAFTAHLKASSLCDMILAITPYVVESEAINQEVESAVALVRKAGDARNDIAHGPFWLPRDTDFIGTVSFKARSKIKVAEKPFSTERFREILADHIAAWQAIAHCYVGAHALAEERARLGLSPLRPDFVLQASRQTPIGQPQE